MGVLTVLWRCGWVSSLSYGDVDGCLDCRLGDVDRCLDCRLGDMDGCLDCHMVIWMDVLIVLWRCGWVS